MDTSSRKQIRLILEDAAIQAKKATESRLRVVYSKRLEARYLRPGQSLIKSVATAAEEIAVEFIKYSVDRIAPVAKNVEAFGMIQEAVEGFLRFLGEKIDMAAMRDTAARGNIEQLDDVRDRARRLYARIQADLMRQLELHRFVFTVPQRPVADLSKAPVAAPEFQAPLMPKNPGGKPRAAHWDAMWVEICMQVYEGDLQPKTQADIERAMKDWLASRDVDIGDTAVRERAKLLWARLPDFN